jgi:hypothetical protein
MIVWVACLEGYDGSEILGISESYDGGKRICAEYAKKTGEEAPGKWTGYREMLFASAAAGEYYMYFVRRWRVQP